MTWYHFVNGAVFECVGGALVWLNVRRIWRDRAVAGFEPGVSLFFGLWGLWNIFYYAAVGDPVSMWAAVLLGGGNMTFAVLAIYYSRIRPWLDLLEELEK